MKRTHFKTKLLLMFVAGLSISSTAQALVINELMQSNIDMLIDDLNEYPDSWVELYNPEEAEINLNEFSIGIEPDASKSWKLPSQTIQANTHYVVFCDKEGIRNHTDFRLESGKGCCVYLFKGGKVVDQITDLKKMPAPNISYGRETDGSETWGYQLNPTPNAKNCGGISSELLGAPIFSISGRIMTTTDILELSIPPKSPENTVIRYTTDGSEPTMSSMEYTAPIAIDSTLAVRAKLFAEGYLSPVSTTHSYIFHDRSMTLPIISIVTDDANLYSDKLGILSDFVGESGQANFFNDWRRPINFEYYISENQDAELNQLCETRLKGHGSRVSPIKSMVVYANKRFGTKRLAYEFFPDQKPGLLDFKSIELRNAGNDCNYTYMKDAVIQRSMGQYADLDWQAWNPAVVYLNGQYHGILNIRERSNEDHVYSNYDGLEDIDMIENWQYLVAGSFDAFNLLSSMYFTDTHSFDEYDDIVDLKEFCNYFIMNIYFCNMDFPGNNMVMWRPLDSSSKWRWIAKDTDLGLGLYQRPYDFKTLEWLYDETIDDYGWINKDRYTKMFRTLMDIPNFRQMFIDRFSVYIGDFLCPDKINGLIDDMSALISSEWTRHDEKNVGPDYKGHREWFRDQMKNWVIKRHDYIYEHLLSFYGIGPSVYVEVIGEYEDIDSIEINDITLTSKHFKGRYYENGNLAISMLTSENSGFNGWIAICESADKDCNIIETPGKSVSFHIPAGTEKITFVPTTVNTSVEYVPEQMTLEIYTLDGVRINATDTECLRKGIYIIKEGNMVRKTVIK